MSNSWVCLGVLPSRTLPQMIWKMKEKRRVRDQIAEKWNTLLNLSRWAVLRWHFLSTLHYHRDLSKHVYVCCNIEIPKYCCALPILIRGVYTEVEGAISGQDIPSLQKQMWKKRNGFFLEGVIGAWNSNLPNERAYEQGSEHASINKLFPRDLAQRASYFSIWYFSLLKPCTNGKVQLCN